MKRNWFPWILKGTAFLFSVLTVILFACNDYCTDGPVGSCAITGLTIVFHLAMRLAVGTWIPNRFHTENAWFQVKPWEEKLYRKLNIKQWKKHIPTYDPQSFTLQEQSLGQIIANMRHAEVVHEVIVVLSFLPAVLFTAVFGEFFVFFITSLAAALIDLVFVALQRSNRPRLIRILEKQSRKS